MNTLIKLSPRITTMIKMDHTHVLATFHKYRTDASPDKKEALVATVCAALEIHARLEEEIFYPAMRAADSPVVDKSIPEHNEMRRLISALRGMDPTDGDYDVTFMNLMRAVIHHVADEETILLPEAERVLADRLEELGAAMTKRRIELIGPRAGEIAVNTVRSYPAVALAAMALLVVGSYALARGTRASVPQRMLSTRRLKSVVKPAQKWLEKPANRLLSYVR